MSASNYLETSILNCFLGYNFSKSSVYLALFKTPASETSGGEEPSDPQYERQRITFSNPVQPSSAPAYITNENRILSKAANASWGNIVGYGLFDAKTGGNLLIYGQLDSPKRVLTGEKFSVEPRDLRVNLD